MAVKQDFPPESDNVWACRRSGFDLQIMHECDLVNVDPFALYTVGCQPPDGLSRGLDMDMPSDVDRLAVRHCMILDCHGIRIVCISKLN